MNATNTARNRGNAKRKMELENQGDKEDQLMGEMLPGILATDELVVRLHLVVILYCRRSLLRRPNL